MGEAASNYGIELEELGKIMEKLEESLISTKQELKEETEKNTTLTEDLHKLKQTFKNNLSTTKSTKQIEDQLKFALKKLDSTQEQTLLLKKKLAKIQEKLSQQVTENHKLNIDNENLKQEVDRLTSNYESAQSLESVKNEIPQIDMTSSTSINNDYKNQIQKLQNDLAIRKQALLQQKKEKQKLKEQLISIKQQMFSKEEMADMFVQAKKLAREKVLKDQAQIKAHEEEKYLNTLSEEKNKLYNELLKMAQINQKFITRLADLKDKERHLIERKGVEKNE
ncbi:MAG: hypothetical protein LBF82_03200 [Lactobacillales bacterium]|jgi:regulator of replication initiation timing|nr:hypothetical protein [Lactobacillales bacterium]